MPSSQSESLIVCIQMAFQIWWLFRGAYKVFFKKRRGRRKTILQVCVGWLLLRRVCSALRKQQDIKQNTERCFVVEKAESRAERVGDIDARDLDLLIAIFFFKFERKTENNDECQHRWGLSVVTCLLDFVSAFSVSSVQHDEDLGCAARFAIAIKFAFGSTIICDLLFK